MNRYSKEVLVNVVTQLAAGMGVPFADAALFAEVLVDADMSGVSTHGVSRLNIYLKRIELGPVSYTHLDVYKRQVAPVEPAPICGTRACDS